MVEVDTSICFGCEELERRQERDRETPVPGRKYGMYPREE